MRDRVLKNKELALSKKREIAGSSAEQRQVERIATNIAPMSAKFLPLASSRLHAHSYGAEGSPYIVAAMFTEDMKGYAERLKQSLEKIGLSFVLYQVPTVHCSISPRGTKDITFCKPNFIYQVQNEYHVPLLYVDADVVFREPPRKLLQAAQERIDFGCYNWLADRVTNAYRPINFVFNGTPTNNRFYRFSHSIDQFDSTQLIVSGAVQYYTPDARPLLQAWLEAIERFPSVADDELLDYTYNYVIEKSSIRASWWNKDYCRYPWWIYVRPVIDHPQFPARGTLNRDFRSATGHERFKAESVKLYPSEAPFPRDCLVDTEEKCLWRVDNHGGAALVAHFTTELWI
jgi:hypothetical protein